MTTAKKQAPSTPLRDAYAMAVLTGIYASSGLAILEATGREHADAMRHARDVAFEQADLMLKEAQS